MAVAVLVIGACSGATPELVAVSPTATVEPTAAPTAIPAPTATPAAVPTATPAATPTAEPTTVGVVASTRGVTESTVRIGVVKSGAVFGDVEVGVQARLNRTNVAGGVGGRQLEVATVRDDGAEPDAALAAVRELVEVEEVFAVVLASAVPVPEVTDYLEAQQVPFFGWGFAPGFCAPNSWGFGFNGCLIGAVLGLDGAAPDATARGLVEAFLERPATVVFVADGTAAGRAATFQAEQVWGEQLLETVTVEGDDDTDRAAIEGALERHDADVVVLGLTLDEAIGTKAWLLDAFAGLVIDDVSYLPGLLGDFATADRLEGGYAVTQFPPQEEYRDVTAAVSTDLQAVGGDLIYSQAVSLGYWSADLLIAMLADVGPELDTATFFEAANIDGLEYAPELAGAPCPINTLDIHRRSAGGAALVRVVGGIYRPVVEFGCYS